MPSSVTNRQGAKHSMEVVRSSTSRPNASLLFALRACFEHRALIRQLTVRDVVGRYRGSVLGLGWSFLTPVLMLLVYTFVFSVVLGARWGISQTESRLDFALILFVGLMVHGLFAECANRAPGLVLGNANLVKKVVFPLELLPVVAVCSAMFHLAVTFLVFLVAVLVTGGKIPVTAALFPLVVLPLVVATLGVAWILASLGVFLRDVAQTTTIITTALLFLSPVFYPTSAVPEAYRVFFAVNPLTFIIEQARATAVWGYMPDWLGLGLYSIAALAFAALGFWWFQRTRRGFADVL